MVEAYELPTTSLNSFFQHVGTLAIAIAFKLITLLILLAAAAVFAAYILVGVVLQGVALALLPLALAFYIFPPLSFFAHGAIKFFFTASLYKVVGFILLSFLQPITSAVGSITPIEPGDAAAINILGSGLMILVAVVILLLATQIPALASALVSGAGSVGSISRPKMPDPQKPAAAAK